MPILIKRYANRKLYNTESSRYITLKGIAELLDQGKEVQVIDNETGEDITSVALSQILVDSKRKKSEPPSSLLSQIIEKGGDALYDALKRGVGDASGGLGEWQHRFRQFVQQAEEEGFQDSPSAGSDSRSSGHQPGGSDRRGLRDWIAYATPDLEEVIQNAMSKVLQLFELPQRKDIETLNENLERVADAITRLERSLAQSSARIASAESTGEPNSERND